MYVELVPIADASVIPETFTLFSSKDDSFAKQAICLFDWGSFDMSPSQIESSGLEGFLFLWSSIPNFYIRAALECHRFAELPIFTLDLPFVADLVGFGIAIRSDSMNRAYAGWYQGRVNW